MPHRRSATAHGILGAAVIAATALTVTALPAQARSHVAVTLTAPPFMLAPADVPTALGVPKKGKSAYIVTGMSPDDMSLCLPQTGQPELTSIGAAGWQTTVMLQGKGTSSVTERLNTFGDTQAGTSTFATLAAAAAQCNGTSTQPISDDPSHPINGTYTNTNSSGQSGNTVWISITTKAKSKDPKVNGQVSSTYTSWTTT